MATYTATSASQADVNFAITGMGAISGDTVLFSGSAIWGSGGSIVNIDRSITLQGAGTNNTFITLADSAPQFYSTIGINANNVTVRDFTISGNGANGCVMGGTQSSFRVTNIVYQGNGSQGYFFLGGGTGLIDSCQISGGNGQAELIFLRGPLDAWQRPSPCGTPNAVYVEDCAFSGPGYVCDANSNSSIVVRFCTVSGTMKVDGHGFDSNNPAHSVRTMEVYNNTWQATDYAAQIRGGAGFSFNNLTYAFSWFQLINYASVSAWLNYGSSISGVATGISGIITTQTPHGISGVWPVSVYCSNSSPIIGTNAGFYSPTIYTVTPIDSYRLSIPLTITGAGTAGGNNSITRFMTPIDYPTNDQIGVGQDPKVGGSQPYYIWNHRVSAGGTGTQTNWDLSWINVDTGAIYLYQQQLGNTGVTFSMQTMISGGRDYFFGTGDFGGLGDIGTGSVDQMLATTPSQTGVGWWAVNTGFWNQSIQGAAGSLFVWSGSWKPYYTPFTYPHPVRGLTFRFPSPKRFASCLKLRGFSL